MDARAQPGAANLHPGGREWLDAESLELEGREGSRAWGRGERGVLVMLYQGVSFQERESLHACLRASKFLAGEGAWGGEGGVCMYIGGGGGGGEQISCGEAECIWRGDFLEGGLRRRPDRVSFLLWW